MGARTRDRNLRRHIGTRVSGWDEDQSAVAGVVEAIK